MSAFPPSVDAVLIADFANGVCFSHSSLRPFAYDLSVGPLNLSVCIFAVRQAVDEARAHALRTPKSMSNSEVRIGTSS